ncbi:aspartate/glutamate racemase family protein [uncultured Nocardioides sp.]|uniref:Aspartate racemase n=1 Tax=uncultured Nocardioides sp. TaxID=198441 RepID=A0A6J4PAI6_9ACTN|nr:aspartate/glutamate racemase family protein [uncultured Nocardioides sp.]CAA9410562.1 MAG: Aspartate racemase [uncultured Nocardioides sp.]
MQTIGLIGGMSWHSTASYYRIVNETVAARLGGHASARITLQSLDFAEVRACQLAGDWDRAAALLTDAARACVAGGADVVAICTNLMHKVAPQVEAGIDVPLVHIADAVAGLAAPQGWDRLGILGARWVMEETFYADRLGRHGITALSPDAADRDLVDRVIFDELTQGRVEDASRRAYVEVIERLAARGAQAVVLACTEIGLLVSPADSPLPLIDSADAHARALAEVALSPAFA